MYWILFAILISCTGNANGGAGKEIYDRSVDDIFKSIVGDPNKIKQQMIERGKTYKWKEQTFPPKISTMLLSNIFNFSHTKINNLFTTTKRKQITVAETDFKEINENVTRDLNYHRFRLRKLELKRLLKDENSPLPNFAKDQDNPAHITRRFDKLIAESEENKPQRRELYFEYQMPEISRIWNTKVMMKDLISHFVYATRYKLPYMQRLRLKYKEQLRYQIGYCFALLRLLRQQQKQIYSSLMDYYKLFNNLLIHMKMYEKIVRFDVDIKDVCKLVKVLNYKKKLEDDPTYYDDSVESSTNAGTNLTAGELVSPKGAVLPEGAKAAQAGGEAAPPARGRPSRRAIGAEIPGAASLSRRAIRLDTSQADSLIMRDVKPPYSGFPEKLDLKPYEMEERKRKSMSHIVPVLRNGRRQFAPLPEGIEMNK